MRPLRIEMEGFSAFRDRAEVDLAGAELFALVGPTGAGKSSVIDAMVFALYGSVPRYDSENLVHPVITQGAVEAKVRLDFRVGDADYIATRVVRRTKTGATTKEARLERCEPGAEPEEAGTTVLADDAKGLTAAVCDLLGLDLEQFTKCVVLPQGAFATLLHDSKAKRQDLLVKLLDLGVYERVAGAARAEAKQAAARAELLDEQLERSAHATDDAVQEAAARVASLGAVIDEIDAAAPVLAALDEERRTSEAALASREASLASLRGIEIPAGVDDIAQQARSAAEAVAAATAEEARTADIVTAAERARAELPDEATRREQQRLRARAAELEGKVRTGTELVADLDAASPAIARRVAEADAALADATAALERTRIEHAAADLARHLHVGDDCPVCGSTVHELPEAAAVTVTDAEARVRSATTEARAAADARTAHETKLAEYRARLDERIAERDQAAAALADVPSVEEIEAALERIAAADQALADARRDDARARRAAADARRAADAAARRVTDARSDFVATRDRVAALGPPPADDDLAAAWSALVSWADTQRNDLAEQIAAHRARRDDAVKRHAEQLAVLADRARAAGVDVAAPERARDACVAAVANARARLDQLRADRDRAAELRDERAALDERRQVHELLAEHLGARGFEAWLLDEALDALLEGASAWLEQLSSGRYAMAVDDKKQFAVIDHANADERRLARTLSGGETFLASLALALALAERVSELAAGGGTTLDAIFLDEGFGTLDPATLDVVATAIEELGATGRMVGVISHVRELAERVPVRFEITKAPGTSGVHRVES